MCRMIQRADGAKTLEGNGGVRVGRVQPDGLTLFAVGCTHRQVGRDCPRVVLGGASGGRGLEEASG